MRFLNMPVLKYTLSLASKTALLSQDNEAKEHHGRIILLDGYSSQLPG